MVGGMKQHEGHVLLEPFGPTSLSSDVRVGASGLR